MQQQLLKELRLEEGPILKKKLVIPYYSEAMKAQRAQKKAYKEEMKRKLQEVPPATPDAIRYGGAACTALPSEGPAPKKMSM
jgi:hypothetical protein